MPQKDYPELFIHNNGNRKNYAKITKWESKQCNEYVLLLLLLTLT